MEPATAIGWVVSPIIKLVMDKTQTYITNKFFQKAGIESDLGKIHITLKQILSDMDIVEKQRIREPNRMELMEQVKGAVYDAEDVLDEVEYYRLQEILKKEKSTSSRVAASIFQVVIRNDKLQSKIQTITKSLDVAKDSANKLREQMSNATSSHEVSQQLDNVRAPGPIMHNVPVGRVKEHKELIKLLLKGEDEPPLIIPIVGDGGIGKTTLAQMVYNDEKIQGRFDPEQQRKVGGHFNLMMWISVGNNFDKIRITKEMVKYADKNISTVDSGIELLRSELENRVRSTKVLVVLDDVWYNEKEEHKFSYKEKWSILLAPLMKAAKGSKILLTTRLDQVATILGNVKPIILEGLSPDDSWTLFKNCALGNEHQDNQIKFEPLGRKIVKKLKGSALAINVVGTQLRGNYDIEQWESFLNNDLSGINDIMDILYLSYENLPKYLQPCFAYCSLFRKDLHLNPDRLVFMWIAQGFVCPNGTDSLEEIGRAYFDDLLSRSFFQKLIQGEEVYYVMHDFMDELACHVSKGECFLLEDGSNIREILSTVRHLSVSPKAVNILRDFTGIDKVRTLILLEGSDDHCWDNNMVTKLKRARVLELRPPSFKLPRDIGRCKHLRYLSFPNTEQPLPDSIGKLHHLRTFIKEM